MATDLEGVRRLVLARRRTREGAGVTILVVTRYVKEAWRIDLRRWEVFVESSVVGVVSWSTACRMWYDRKSPVKTKSRAWTVLRCLAGK